jgi:two-component system LytT family sensor kinase
MTEKRDWSKKMVGSRLKYIGIVFLISVGAAFYFTGGKLFTGWYIFLVGTSWSMAIWYSQSLGNGWIIDRLDERISWLEQPGKRFIIGFTALITYSFVAFQIVQMVFGYLAFGWKEENYFGTDEFWIDFWQNGRLAVIISLVIATVLTSIGFFRGWKSQAVRAEQLEKEAYIRQYNALRDQLNPHFLFNSLNVLTELVYEDQDQAVSYIRKLSDVYRFVLDSSKQEVIELEQELEFTEKYVGLLQERFGDNLSITWHKENGSSQFIVPMSLQLLIENAVKHNVISKQDPLAIDIRIDENAITVSNSLKPKSDTTNSTGLGLKYLRDRYERLASKDIKVTESISEKRFSVELPTIEIA